MDFYGDEPHQSLDDTHALIQQLQASYNRREALFWGITLKGEDTIIGSCAFISFDSGKRGRDADLSFLNRMK